MAPPLRLIDSLLVIDDQCFHLQKKMFGPETVPRVQLHQITNLLNFNGDVLDNHCSNSLSVIVQELRRARRIVCVDVSEASDAIAYAHRITLDLFHEPSATARDLVDAIHDIVNAAREWPLRDHDFNRLTALARDLPDENDYATRVALHRLFLTTYFARFAAFEKGDECEASFTIAKSFHESTQRLRFLRHD